jgi:DNA-binding MarR family transcriptional regulator
MLNISADYCLSRRLSMAKAEKAQVAVLAKSPSHLLHRVLQLALDIYVEETGKGALTQRQYAVLAAASTVDGASQTDLVRMTGIDRSTLADMVARMIERGWLGRERSKTDARAKTVRLTDRGRAALKEIAPKVQAADERILANLVASRRSGFISALGSLADAGGENVLEETGAKKKKKTDKIAKAAKAPKAAKADKAPKDAKKKKKKIKKLHAAAE